ncbi:MAG: lipopolysaccharide heptosyltransferase II [Betaproteobacteria bacterium]
MTAILVVAPSWIGDALLSQPMLALLKQRDPECVIDVLGPGWVLPVYRRMPEVRDTIESPFGHGALALGERMRLGRQLRKNRYEAAYVLPNSFKSALVPLFAAIPKRIGFVGEVRYGLLSDARRLDERALPRMVERFASLASPRGARIDSTLAQPRLQVGDAERDAVMAQLQLARPARLACLCPGAEYGPAKRWPAEYFGDLATKLAGEGYAVWVVGSKKEAEIGEEIRERSGDIALNLCGRTSLDQAVVLLSAADAVVTNDSGLMHVAAALDRPMVALYGSSSPAFTPPLSSQARIVKLDIACSPCFERTCPLGHFNCMMKLMPDRVLGEVHSLAFVRDPSTT